MELKPCPFCGEKPTVVLQRGPSGLEEKWAECLTMDCAMYQHLFLEKYWNRRSDKWIPLKDNLPEEGVEVLVFAPKGARCIYSVHERPTLWVDSIWVDTRDDNAVGGWQETYYLPTHWQPLPEAPKS